MPPRFSARTIGPGTAAIPRLVWTAFIVIACTSAGRSPAAGGGADA